MDTHPARLLHRNVMTFVCVGGWEKSESINYHAEYTDLPPSE